MKGPTELGNYLPLCYESPKGKEYIPCNDGEIGTYAKLVDDFDFISDCDI